MNVRLQSHAVMSHRQMHALKMPSIVAWIVPILRTQNVGGRRAGREA